MEFQTCYVHEWTAYHLDLGATAIYMLPQVGIRPVYQNYWFAHVSEDPRVHAICNVSGTLSSCAVRHAQAFETRSSHQKLLLDHLVPQHRIGSWFMLIDLDEFITVVQPEHTLSRVLRTFSSWGASLVHVNWVVFGSNGVHKNPSCATVNVFRRPARRRCLENRIFKTMFRSTGSLQPFKGGKELLNGGELLLGHIQVAEQASGWFAADGVNVSQCVEAGECRKCQRCFCKKLPCYAAVAPLPEQPLLVLRHFVTRSRDEWFSKIATYSATSVKNLQNYTSRYTLQTSTEGGEPRSARFDSFGDARLNNSCGPSTHEFSHSFLHASLNHSGHAWE